jgi:hypothetical protein
VKLTAYKGFGGHWYLAVRAGHTLTPLACRSTFPEILAIVNTPRALVELERSAEIAAFVAGQLRTGAIR